MPAIPTTAAVINNLIARDSNATSNALQVVCAWPVSGQYGPGSRVLYYALVVACLLARKVEWLKKACLAAALLLPAIAAIHGIVLAIVHTDDAVDMDIYGAFQICAIGILAAPVTVKLSSTYFNDRGRNLIFVWTGLILAGLLSLTVEFYRSNSKSCLQDNEGNPLTDSNPDAFPYGPFGEPFTCGITCDIGPGNPWSPMRSWNGSTNNIYVIPAPHVLTFGTGTLLAAACCLPALLSLASMWNRIAEANWAQHFFPKPNTELDQMIDGTNGATDRQMMTVQEQIKKYLRVAIEIPVFGAAVMAIVILGEKNFWSKTVNYMTEPIGSVGQWGSIVGTALAAFGSLYILLAKAVDDEAMSEYSETKSAHDPNGGVFHASPRLSPARSRHGHGGSPDSPPRVSESEFGSRLTNIMSRRSNATNMRDAGNRRMFAAALNKMGNYIGTPSRKRFDLTEFQQGPATDYPEIPGEDNRNREISQLRQVWTSPSLREQSREGSPDSHLNVSEDMSRHGRESPPPSAQIPTIQLPTNPPRAVRASTLPTGRTPGPLLDMHSNLSGEIRGRRRRRETLEVPSPTHAAQMRNSLPAKPEPKVTLAASDHLPVIVVSPEPEPETSPPLKMAGPSNTSPPTP
ncbi:hypothetical protein BKA67DRAFT_583253 [Truncatella angustata]|uniref:Uncharacterized protein n=1 Tax=Truncatella angustata TaxID=152316 RepID=A0A9P8RKS0_9PEZI|nr:uncharacterized protein BKA67DRAFT_583253 [Truncatella angustata]KAH6646108.1 hypothetical protein BKA67DRAFT_583253 [Truncatella angustata]